MENIIRGDTVCMILTRSEHLISANIFFSGRLFLLDEKFFGLTNYFKPLSQTCKVIPETEFEWPYNMSERVIKMNQHSNYKGHHSAMKGMLPYLPNDLVHRIHWVTPDPENWFLGQFVSYILRPLAGESKTYTVDKYILYVKRNKCL